MVNQKEALDILNSERDYEERIAQELIDYLNYSLKDVEGLSEDEVEKVKAVFSMISEESIGHYKSFTKLIDMVIRNGENNY